MKQRVSVADRLDAAGIGEDRLGSVVEQLTAPTASTGDSIVEIPVKLIEPHPHNRKIAAGDVEELVASIKSGDGIIVPLGVTAGPDWNAGKPDDLAEIDYRHFIITAGGHRRLLAAEQAGLETVPCIVRADFAGAKGRRAALLENLQRKDLDAFEEAEAFAELLAEPYKLSQHAIAGMLGCNQSHVSKRLKLLKLPSLVRESVRVGETSIPDAIELARVADQGPIFDAAWERLHRNRWSTGKEAVDTAIDDHEAKVKTRKATEELEQLGIRRIDRHPTSFAYSKREPACVDALKLDGHKHAGETCHVGYVNNGGEILLACDNPGRHLKAGDSPLKLTKSVADRLSSSSGANGYDEARHRAERRDLKKLWPGRAAIARELVYGRDDLPPATEAELLARGMAGLAFDGVGRADTWKALRDFVTPLETADYPTDQAVDELLRKMPAVVAQRAMALAFFESRLRSTLPDAWDSGGRYYLDLLASRGYTITALEKKKLGKTKIAETDDVVRRCVKCGCTDEQACDGGCQWVAEDLCSSCADAVDGGFLDEHEQLLEASEAVG